MNDTDQLLRIVSNKQQHNAQQNGEHDDLERVTSGQRFKNIRRDPGDQIFQKIIRNCLPGLRTQKIRPGWLINAIPMPTAAAIALLIR